MGRLLVQPGQLSCEIPPTRTILSILLEHRIVLHYNCRRGLCGQDLIRIISGMEHLNPIGEPERGTLALLQVHDAPLRMACCTYVLGSGEVTIEIV